jgi:hypothetical protein
MRKPFFLLALLLAFAVRGEEPRINRISPAAKEEAREALLQALRRGGVADGTAFADLVQCGPRLWARIHEKFRRDDDSVLRTTNLFDGAAQAKEWGFLLAPSAEADPERKAVSESLGAAAGRTPIQMAAFRNGGEKRLGPHVARFLASPALPVIRDANDAEIWYLWMLVPYDLDEPIFVIQLARTRLLVNLDAQHKIHWIDVLPDNS